MILQYDWFLSLDSSLDLSLDINRNKEFNNVQLCSLNAPVERHIAIDAES